MSLAFGISPFFSSRRKSRKFGIVMKFSQKTLKSLEFFLFYFITSIKKFLLILSSSAYQNFKCQHVNKNNKNGECFLASVCHYSCLVRNSRNIDL